MPAPCMAGGKASPNRDSTESGMYFRSSVQTEPKRLCQADFQRVWYSILKLGDCIIVILSSATVVHSPPSWVDSLPMRHEHYLYHLW
ncbi:MAG: hypothetical protein L6Q49_07310 [Anaerolineales bacterium]|nr:hypothetical protein [Anaerolineales bacterium]